MDIAGQNGPVVLLKSYNLLVDKKWFFRFFWG